MSFVDKQDFLNRAQSKLANPYDELFANLEPLETETPFVPGDGSGLPIRKLRPAAVLFGLIDRGEDFGVVFTQRPQTMKAHAGQIALPGGKLEQEESVAQAAVREAEEEIGIPRDQVELIGQAEPYRTLSGFCVSLMVGVLPNDFVPKPCEHEVDDVFETPLSFLMRPENHQVHEVEWGGALRRYYAMPHNNRNIWGVTAGMIKSLYDRLYDSP
ncbi:NUDIX hydrolase [Hirschia maritima]|uniref:NUDIX hydrolase n=1 Tax=Hirschia maritima TaxID=1121961 RepID=UPI0003765F4D|nr:CoA pyrophosphatase [Hirschia maritima]